MGRCFITGAVRFGMRPLRAVAWWQRGWEACQAYWDLPLFPSDPMWGHLVRSASSITLTATPAEGAEDETAIQNLTVADFGALEPQLSIARLDEEFVETWKTWVPITPGSFCSTSHVAAERGSGRSRCLPRRFRLRRSRG